MDSLINSDLKTNALEIIKNYRVPDLQALLDYARLSRQGNKRELFQRCKILISSNLTPQLINKINQINSTRINLTKTHHSHSIIPLPISSIDVLPIPNHVQYIHLPFFDTIRTIESINIPVNWNTFSPLYFVLNDFEMDLIVKNLAKIFLRIVPTAIPEKQNDVLPPYLFVQCNDQTIINNNVSKTVGSQAHSIVFPTDITDKINRKSNVQNILNYFWLQLPINMSFKNLPKSYTLTIQLVRCVSIDILFDNILKREIQLKPNNNDDSDIEIEDIGLMTTRHRVSLICPITQSLINVPAKSINCSHLTCFDLRSFLQMNQRRLQWSCPLCKKSASYETLCIDKRLQTILSNVPPNCSTVEIDSSTKILSDCQYILDNVKQEQTNVDITTVLQQNDSDQESIHNSPINSRRQSIENDCIVLSSENESEDENSNIVNNDSPIPITSFSNDRTNQNNIMNEKQINNADEDLLQSLISSNDDDDGSYWEDLARITYQLISENNNEQNFKRKRNNNNDDDYYHQKRQKQSLNNKSKTNDIEIITIISSDSSDNDNELS